MSYLNSIGASAGGSVAMVTKGRWGEDAPTDTSEARERLLDSAEACFIRFGLNKTTVDDVATHAKVSRATVYRYFEGRDALILGVLERELGRLSQEMTGRLDLLADLPTFIAESIMLTINAVRTNEHLALLFAPQAAGITGEVAGASESLFKMNTNFLRPHLERAQRSGDLRAAVDLNDLAEWTLRITLSLLTVQGPTTRTKKQTREFLMLVLKGLLTGEGA